MPSIINVCNMALISIGADVITSFSDSAKEARTCNVMWAPCRDAVLRAVPWNCAIARATLSALSDAPEFGFSYQYQLPSDCLNVLEMEDEESVFRIEGQKLLTDEEEAVILYVRSEIDPNQWDALLVETVASRLAAEICYAITGSQALAQQCWKLYGIKISEASVQNARRGGTPVQSGVESTWLSTR